jgi:hypothetical protein
MYLIIYLCQTTTIGEYAKLMQAMLEQEIKTIQLSATKPGKKNRKENEKKKKKKNEKKKKKKKKKNLKKDKIALTNGPCYARNFYFEKLRNFSP